MPLPIWVVKNGICSRRTKLFSPAVERGRLQAAPSMISGRSAASIMLAARSRAARCATGSSIGCTRTIGTASVISPAMSSGSSSSTGPGRSSVARWKASRTSVGMELGLTIWRDSLVSGRNAPTTSTIWKRAWRDDRIPFWPVIITIGIAPRLA